MKPILEDATQKCREAINKGIKFTVATRVAQLVRVLWNFDSDHSGEPAVFFRIVLTDKARDELLKTTREIETALTANCQLERFVLQSYFNFRSESEQKALKDPDWE